MADIVTKVPLPEGSVVVGVVVGGVITLLCSWLFYLKAAKGLKSEAAEVRRLTTLVLRGMEEAGLAELNQDKSGKITGLVLKDGASLKGRGSASARATVVERGQPSVGAPDQSIGNQNA